eukprot:1156960-Pelagomonas_calceolata.AAC.5
MEHACALVEVLKRLKRNSTPAKAFSQLRLLRCACALLEHAKTTHAQCPASLLLCAKPGHHGGP